MNVQPTTAFGLLLALFQEWSHWVQIVSAAIFTYLVLSIRSGDIKKPWRIPLKILFIIGVTVATQVVLSFVTENLRPLAGAGAWLAVAASVAIFALFFSRYDRNARFVVSAVAISTIIIVNQLGMVFGMMLEKLIPGFSQNYAKAFADVLLVFAGWYLIKYPIWRVYVSYPAMIMSVFSNALSALTVIIYDLFRINFFGPDESVSSMLLMSIVMLTLYLINTVSYQMICRLSHEQTQVLALQARTQMDKSSSSLLVITENNLNELHKIKHDIQNQYAYMRMLLRNESYEALSQYFDELTDSFSEPLVPFVDCGNRVLDLIFNMEHAKAQEAGIALDIKAAPPHELPFKDVDLCSLYTNTIDNAIEACAAEKMPEAAVRVTVSVHGDYLFTQITNPTKKTKSFLEKGAQTTKSDRRQHGKGISIARGIVRRYNGRFAARIENGMFYTEFMLDLTYTPEKENE